MQVLQVVGQVQGQPRSQRFAARVQGGGIGRAHGQRQVGLRRQVEQQGLERGVRGLVGERAAHRLGVAFLADLVGLAAGPAEDQGAGQLLPGLPAVEQVRVAGQQDIAVARLGVAGELHRRREAAQRGDHRSFVDAGEGERGPLAAQHDDRLVEGHPVAQERLGAAVGVQQADDHRNRQRALGGLTRGRGRRLHKLKFQFAALGVIAAGQADLRRAGLLIPGEEGGQILVCHLGEAADEFLHGGGVAIPAFEVEIHAGAERLRPDQSLQHADHFRALFVDRRGVEVVDLQIARRPHGMGQRTLVLGELAGAQRLDVLDPLHGVAALVRREALVAEDRQALLEAQLEPVAAGDPVAGPVVEILVSHDAFDAFEIHVGGGRRIGQQQGRVEDIQPLVLHRPEVEVAHGDNHEQVQVVLAPERRLIPFHRTLERVHGVGGARRHAGIDVDP